MPSRFMTAALAATTGALNTAVSSRKLSRHDGGDEDRQAIVEPLGDVDVEGGRTGDVDAGSGAHPRGRSWSRMARTRSSVASSSGPLEGVTCTMAAVPSSLGSGGVVC